MEAVISGNGVRSRLRTQPLDVMARIGPGSLSSLDGRMSLNDAGVAFPGTGQVGLSPRCHGAL